MALIKATDLAYGRLRTPDLDAAEEFLTNFGMVPASFFPGLRCSPARKCVEFQANRSGSSLRMPCTR